MNEDEFRTIEISAGRVITNRNPLNEAEEARLHTALQEAKLRLIMESNENVVYPEQKES